MMPYCMVKYLLLEEMKPPFLLCTIIVIINLESRSETAVSSYPNSAVINKMVQRYLLKPTETLTMQSK